MADWVDIVPMLTRQIDRWCGTTQINYMDVKGSSILSIHCIEKGGRCCGIATSHIEIWLVPSRQNGLPSQPSGLQAEMPGVGV
jgi:hypothetical protein